MHMMNMNICPRRRTVIDYCKVLETQLLDHPSTSSIRIKNSLKQNKLTGNEHRKTGPVVALSLSIWKVSFMVSLLSREEFWYVP